MTPEHTMRRLMLAAGTGLAMLLAAGLMPGQISAQTDGAGTADAGAGPDSLRENFRDWAVNCETIAEDAPSNPGARVCEMVQQIDHQETGQRVLAFSIRINDEGAPVAVLITPFGLRLAEGVRVQIGEEQMAHLAFETCLPEGCLVIAPMEQELVTAMQQGSDGGVVMVSRQGDAVAVPISLLGFTAGLERLRALSGG